MFFRVLKQSLALTLALGQFFPGAFSSGSPRVVSFLAPFTSTAEPVRVLDEETRRLLPRAVAQLEMAIGVLEARAQLQKGGPAWPFPVPQDAFLSAFEHWLRRRHAAEAEPIPSALKLFSLCETLGLENTRQLRDLLNAAAQTGVLSPARRFVLEKPVPPRRFAMNCNAYQETGLLRRVEMRVFDRSRRAPAAVLADFDEKGLNAFWLRGAAARAAAQAVYAGDNLRLSGDWRASASARQKHRLLRERMREIAQGAFFEVDELREFAAQIDVGYPDGLIQLPLLMMQAYGEGSEEYRQAAEKLEAYLEKLEMQEIVLEGNGQDAVETFNLLALNPRNTDTLRVAAVAVDVGLENAARAAASSAPLPAAARILADAVLNAPEEVEWRLPHAVFSPTEVECAAALERLPAEILASPEIFSRLLRVLKKTHRAVSTSGQGAPDADYALLVRAHALRALQRGVPEGWFERSLGVLADAGASDAEFEFLAEFLADAGWINYAVKANLLRAGKAGPYARGIRETLLSGSAAIEDVRFEGALRPHSFIKRKIFFGNPPVDAETARLAFLRVEEIHPLWEKAGEWACFLGELGRHAALQAAEQRLKGLYRQAFIGEPGLRMAPLKLLILLLPGDGARGVGRQLDAVRWVLYFLSKAVPRGEMEKFWGPLREQVDFGDLGPFYAEPPRPPAGESPLPAASAAEERKEALRRLFPAAPAEEEERFVFDEPRRAQALGLIALLDVAIPYLEARQAQKRIVLPDEWPQEEHRYEYFYPETGKNESLLPALRFLNAFGIEGARRLRADLERFCREGGSAPRRYAVACDRPVGPLRLDRLLRGLKETGAVASVEFEYFRRNDAESVFSIPLTAVSDYDKDGLRAFTLVGGKARRAAMTAFPSDDAARQERRQRMLRDTTAARLFCRAIRDYAQAAQNGDRRKMQSYFSSVSLCGSQYYAETEKKDSRARDEFLTLLQEKEDGQLAEELLKIKSRIEDHLIAIDVDREGEIGYFNLAAFAVDPQRDEAAVAATKVAIDLPRFLDWVSRGHSLRAIVGEILENLPYPEVETDGKRPAVAVSPRAVSLAKTLAAFPPETFRDPYVFYNLLKILAATRDAFPLYEEGPKPHHYGLELRQVLLEALRRHRPGWFAEAVSYLEKTIVLGKDSIDPFDAAADFFEATGWLDRRLRARLSKNRGDAALRRRVTASLRRGALLGPEGEEVSPDDTLSAAAPLAAPEQRLAVLAGIKRRVFFGSRAVSVAGTQLGFLSAAEFDHLAAGRATVGEWMEELPRQLALQKALQRLKGLYHFMFRRNDYGPRAASELLREVKNGIFDFGSKDTWRRRLGFFEWLWRLFESFLSVEEIAEFCRKMIYSALRDNREKEMEEFWEDHLLFEVRQNLGKEHSSLPAETILERLKAACRTAFEEELERLDRLFEEGAEIHALKEQTQTHLREVAVKIQKHFAGEDPYWRELSPKINLGALLTKAITSDHKVRTYDGPRVIHTPKLDARLERRKDLIELIGQGEKFLLLHAPAPGREPLPLQSPVFEPPLYSNLTQESEAPLREFFSPLLAMEESL